MHIQNVMKCFQKPTLKLTGMARSAASCVRLCKHAMKQMYFENVSKSV